MCFGYSKSPSPILYLLDEKNLVLSDLPKVTLESRFPRSYPVELLLL